MVSPAQTGRWYSKCCSPCSSFATSKPRFTNASVGSELLLGQAEHEGRRRDDIRIARVPRRLAIGMDRVGCADGSGELADRAFLDLADDRLQHRADQFPVQAGHLCASFVFRNCIPFGLSPVPRPVNAGGIACCTCLSRDPVRFFQQILYPRSVISRRNWRSRVAEKSFRTVLRRPCCRAGKISRTPRPNGATPARG